MKKRSAFKYHPDKHLYFGDEFVPEDIVPQFFSWTPDKGVTCIRYEPDEYYHVWKDDDCESIVPARDKQLDELIKQWAWIKTNRTIDIWEALHEGETWPENPPAEWNPFE